MATRIASCVRVIALCAFLALPGFAVQAAPASSFQALTLYSNQAMVVDQNSGRVLYDKNADVQKPIASITKLMTAIVTMDAELSMEQKISITRDDVDTLRKSRSRLKVGPKHSRRELLQLALMSSENRAASALARSYPGGRPAFIKAMNAKASSLGMKNTRFRDSTGLDSGNVSTARDLVKLVQSGFTYPLIRQFTTETSYELNQGKILNYKNSNPLFRDKNWQIGLSKTGYIIPAGHCLVMQTKVEEKPLIIVLLDADARGTVSVDSNRIKSWFAGLLGSGTQLAATTSDAISEVLANMTPSQERRAQDASLIPQRVRASFGLTEPFSRESDVVAKLKL